MLDDLRNSRKEKGQVPRQAVESGELGSVKKQFLGMTPSQRFVVALFLLIITLILGCSCLWIFGKIQIPFG
jgi:hypothetical protein